MLGKALLIGLNERKSRNHPGSQLLFMCGPLQTSRCISGQGSLGTTLRWGRAPGKPSRAGAFWAQTEDPSGGGAALPRQGRWDPASLRPALRLGGQATAWECSPGDLHISVLLLSNSHYDLSHHKDYLVIVTNPSNSVPCNALGYHVIIAVPLWTSL